VIQPFTTSTYDSMSRLNIDTIGPLDISVHGYQYILVIIDTFSRYITLWPTRSTTAIEAADAGACERVNATVEASPLNESEM
jgi:hypothetical protein